MDNCHFGAAIFCPKRNNSIKIPLNLSLYSQNSEANIVKCHFLLQWHQCSVWPLLCLCVVNFQTLIITLSVVGGVLIIAFFVCVFCCCKCENCGWVLVYFVLVRLLGFIWKPHSQPQLPLFPSYCITACVSHLHGPACTAGYCMHLQWAPSDHLINSVRPQLFGSVKLGWCWLQAGLYRSYKWVPLVIWAWESAILVCSLSVVGC